MAEETKKSKRGGPRKGAGRKPKAGEHTPPLPATKLPPQLVANIWQPGQSGNPAGRPKGARSKLGEAFLRDFYEDWMQHGRAAIQTVREWRPQDYLKAAVAILPKEVKVTPGDYEDMSDEQLNNLIRGLARAVELEIGAGESIGGEETAH